MEHNRKIPEWVFSCSADSRRSAERHPHYKLVVLQDSFCNGSFGSNPTRGAEKALTGFFYNAPRVGFEPTANRLTVDCSTAELPWNVLLTNVNRGNFNKIEVFCKIISVVQSEDEKILC